MTSILSTPSQLSPSGSTCSFQWRRSHNHRATRSTVKGASLGGEAEGQHSNRLHILGAGNVGNFVAYNLGETEDRPPITLLLHRIGLLEAWRTRGENIELSSNGTSEVRSRFDVELVLPVTSSLDFPAGVPEDPRHEAIDNLIVTVKAPYTVSALRSVRERLSPRSTVLFLQNGMGVLDEVNDRVFPDLATRPNYMLGIISHGINSSKPFVIKHAGIGTVSLGSTSAGENPMLPTSSYLQEIFLKAAPLHVTVVSREELIRLQWEKLAMNAVINPVTAIIDQPNGNVLEPEMVPSLRVLIAEISAVIQSLPDSEMHPDTKTNFLPERLETLVTDIATKTAKNISSMLQDVRAGKRTEIEYITGYLLRRAEELGVSCDENRKLMSRVLEIQHTSRLRIATVCD